jgi:hypothetical protein
VDPSVEAGFVVVVVVPSAGSEVVVVVLLTGTEVVAVLSEVGAIPCDVQPPLE